MSQRERRANRLKRERAEHEALLLKVRDKLNLLKDLDLASSHGMIREAVAAKQLRAELHNLGVEC